MSLSEKCPQCNVAWQEEESIYEHFFLKYGDSAKARAAAKQYGDTPGHPQHFSKNVIAIQTEEYDGVSYYKCTNCETIFDKWAMEKINE